MPAQSRRSTRHYRYSTHDGEAQSLLPRTCKLCLRRSQQHNHLIVGPISKAISRYAKSEPDGPRRKALSFIKQRATPSIILPCKAEIATISIHINHHPTCPRSKSHMHPLHAWSPFTWSRPTYQSSGCPTVPQGTDHPIWVCSGPTSWTPYPDRLSISLPGFVLCGELLYPHSRQILATSAY